MDLRNTKIQRVDTDPDKRIIAVSDIHGYADYLDGVLKKVHYSSEDILVIVGDLIEKGMESLKTVRYILKLRENNENVYTTMGNGEQFMLSLFFADSREKCEEFINGLHWRRQVYRASFFLDILDELGIDLDDLNEENILDIKKQIRGQYQEELDFLCNLPTILAMGEFIFVHAGIPTDSLDGLEDTEASRYVKIDAFMDTDIKFQKTVVVGHWPVYLYRNHIDCVNPLFDHEKHIIGIDGGCGHKAGAQLNALIIPSAHAAMRDVSYVSYDDLPVITAEKSQAARERSLLIRWFDSEVKLLEREGNLARVLHVTSQREFEVPVSWLYESGDRMFCNDYSDGHPEISEGDRLSVIERTKKGMIVKKDGVIGWYKC